VHDVVLLAKLAQDFQLDNINEYFRRDVFPKKLLKKLEPPHRNSLHIRLLKDRTERDALRTRKQVTKVNLKIFEKNPDKIWDVLPDNFDCYRRSKRPYEEEIQEAWKRSMEYSDLGCDFLSRRIQSDISKFEEKQISCCGFNKITMTNAAIILAKRLGITSRYAPYAYPIHILPIRTQFATANWVDSVESLPEIKNKALFDNFWVISPKLDFGCFVLLGERDGKCYFINYFKEG
jgi:hypothetical protein